MTASTAHHLWSLDDNLGQGATANVYKARNKKKGEVVAVKVFNVASYSRPYEVQMREFDMLRRLNHVNIVKLFAVEEMHLNPKQKVLVMEFCSGGSLLNVLEEPKNAFGLCESEFLIVLRCVVHGIKHLRDNGVVHRDIKPGNIMRQVGEDGRSIYKLTDFGAARELEDDETFMSIYGTEEYLVRLALDITTYILLFHDFWNDSISVALCLYLRHKITTEKPDKVIAGVQKVENGEIEWSYQLPDFCQLSEGLKMQLVPVLANILEANQEKCWGFDQFFAATTDILQRIHIHIFSLQQATAHTIYIHFYNTASIFFEEVQVQTGIVPEVQQYFFQGHPLPMEPSMKVVNLPPTTPDRPIFLLSRRPEKMAVQPPKEPETPVMPSRFDVVADYSFSKTMVRVIQQFLRIAQSLHKHRDLILQGFYSYIESVRIECSNTAHKIAMVNMKLLSCLTYPFHVQKMETLSEKIAAIHQQYRQDKLADKLSYNDEQIHKFEKLNLSSHIKKVKGLFRDDCLQRYQEVLAAVGVWSSSLYDMQARLEQFSGFFLQLIGDLQMCERHQTKRLRDEMETVARELQNNNHMIERYGVFKIRTS
uniref:Inhibitor of nuclear factor kappa B kinase subunit epsilon n=1 Tax=Astyanax mexicanus TaxID=7994 RepID=A0A8B9R8X1_ASTMX